jgi:hypothetical protein
MDDLPTPLYGIDSIEHGPHTGCGRASITNPRFVPVVDPGLFLII